MDPDQILSQLKAQKVGCWHSNGSRNMAARRACGGAPGVCVALGGGIWGAQGQVCRGCSKQANTMRTQRKGSGYMTGTGESLADTHIHKHMEAGGATLGFTVL